MNTDQQNMLAAGTVTNEILYDLIKDFKDDVNRRFDDVDRRFDEVYRRFDEVDKRFDDVYRRFDEIDRRFDEVYGRFEKNDQRFERLESQMKEIYDCRKEVTVRFTTRWMFASFFIAMLSSTVVLAFDKGF